jgi:hypothetical protein
VTIVLDCSGLDGTNDGAGDNAVAWRVIIHAAALTAATGNQVQVSWRSGSSSGSNSPAISGAWIGQRSGATNNFTGNQVQLKFGGSTTFNITAANQTITSDVATLGENFDSTKDYIVSFRGQTGATAFSLTTGTFSNVDNNNLGASTAGEEALTTATGGYTTVANVSQIRQIIITGGAVDRGEYRSTRPQARQNRFWPGTKGPRRLAQAEVGGATANASLTQADATLSAAATTAVEDPRQAVSPKTRSTRFFPGGSKGPRRRTFDGIFPSLTANAVLTQADAALSAASTLAIAATATLTQADATLSAASTLAIAANATLTQANATLSATTTLAIAANAALTQGDATLSAASTLAIAANAALTQDDAALSASATTSAVVEDPRQSISPLSRSVRFFPGASKGPRRARYDTTVTTGITANASLTQDDAALSAATALAIAATASPTQADATLSAAATVAIAANSSLAQSNATLSAAATLAVAANAALTQDAATLSAATTLAVAANAALIQANILAAFATTGGAVAPQTHNFPFIANVGKLMHRS